MTNQSSDTQPALHSHNVSVRAGRLTKFKGRVASIAPRLSVVATAAVLFSGSAAQAANECGTDEVGQDTVTCGAGDPSYPNYTDGITYTGSDGLTLILDDPDIEVGGSGLRVVGPSGNDLSVQVDRGTVTTDGSAGFAPGLFVQIDNDASTAAVTAHVGEGGEVNTTGDIAHGLLASNQGEGAATAEMEGGAVTTHGEGAYGLWAEIKNEESTAVATAVLAEGEGVVTTFGDKAVGLYANTKGRGAAIVKMEGGTVTTGIGNTTEVKNAHGLYAVISNADSTATATALLEGGTATTNGADSHGLYAVIQNQASEANALAEMEGGTVTTHGADSHGLYADNDGTGDATVRLTRGFVETAGEASDGLLAMATGDQGPGNATVQMTEGIVHTKGRHASGLVAVTSWGGTALVEMEGGTVTTEGGSGLFAWVGNTESDDTATVRMTGEANVSTRGTRAHGLLASNVSGGLGHALAEVNGGTVTTEGQGANGVYSWIVFVEARGTATARISEAEEAGIETKVETKGNKSHGLYAYNPGFGDALAEMKGGTVTTHGDDAHGLGAIIAENTYNMASEATATVQIIAGEVMTHGRGAYGLYAENNASGDAMAQMDVGTITTKGESAHGVWGESARGQAFARMGEGATVAASGTDADGIRAQGATGFDVDVAGSVTGGAGVGAAIRTTSHAGGTIDIARGATVTAGGSGLAIQVEGGAVEITSAGSVTGVVRLGSGDDILELKDGRFAGDIYAGEGNDTVTISAATEYDGSYTLDGGGGANNQLILNGQNILTTAGHLKNWAGIAMNKTELTLAWVTTVDMDLSIDAGSEFRAFGGEGGMTIAGNKVTNEGSVVFSVQNGETGDVIRVEGNYTGSDTGSDVFALDARMDGTDTDMLHFTGDVSGDMEVLIASVGGAGAEGAPLVMDVVTVGGEANGTFTLVGGNYVTSDGEHAMISGAHLYKLAETDGGWALSARLAGGEISWGPSAPIYDSYGASLLAFNAPSGLQARGSSQDFRTLAWSGQAAQTNGSPLWVQMGTEQITSAAEQSTTGAARDSSLWEMEIGADIVLDTSTAGLLVGGLMLSYGTGSTDVSSDFGDGSIETTGLGLGLAATWYDRRGFYVDGQVTVSSYSSDLSSDGRGSLTEGNSGTGYALSIEAGQQLDLGSRLTVIPQAQLSLSSVTFSDFTSEAQGERRVTLEDAVSQQLRLGLEFGAQDQGASGVYGMVNLYHDFGSGSEVRVGPASLTSENEAWALGFGIGGSYAWNDRVDLFGEASYATGLSNAGDVSALSASAGIKVMF
ncbi:autotransporter outer membrane beta-barrel domain-containing protein [uncultured Tateyamaria sp.]|uniref:autotransporter outer membrane beta-barrel domain-containing protein n=1 Tax=uncultured Tateyamaria sp. TaxID=455651 RepID=UPI002629C9DC|nr:autotransporter outer membrane beta-barrel domain-containing protein [uncultured Tateyamaria sp.]